MSTEPSHWYGPMRDLVSLGQTTAKATSLGGLAAAREQHRAQFFTPDAIARLMWDLALPSLSDAQARSEGRLIRVLDNSCGSGRLQQFADPTQHALYGCDVDARCTEALGEVAKAAGFTYEFITAGMESIHARGMDLCLINPPFSLNLSAPTLSPYDCTSYGQFGPGTSAASEAYALHQALEAAQVVVALLPRTYAMEVIADPTMHRLRQVIHLPTDAFRSENAEVTTTILVFAAHRAFERDTHQWTGAAIPAVNLGITELAEPKALRFRVKGITDDAPSITTPVTGDQRVRIVRNGRRIVLKYACGFMLAKCQNALLRETVTQSDGSARHRYPTGVLYAGQGPLSVDTLLAQPDPVAALQECIVRVLRSEGAIVVIDTGLMPYLRKRARRLGRQRIPFARTAFVNASTGTHALPESGAFNAIARRKQLLEPLAWGSPLIPLDSVVPGIVIETPQGKRYQLTWKNSTAAFTAEVIAERFVIESTSVVTGWQQMEPGRLGRFPDIETALRKRMVALGIDRWLWEGYQQDDLIEVLIGRTGSLAGWEMGLGKSRLGAAICLMSAGRRNCLVSEANLVYELARELRKIQLPEDLWQIIEGPEDLKQLRKISLISYSRLRMAVDPARPKWTYAKALRGRIHTMVADEIHVAAHSDSLQTRALWTVNPRCRFGMSGTPCPNMPRSLLPILEFVAGSNNPLQPYGEGPLCRAENIASMNFVPRGTEAFMGRFVTVQWFTNLFADSLEKGAKREVPRIADVSGYREWIAPLIKRRVRQEPDVARYVKVKEPTQQLHVVEFDPEHLRHYLDVADSFASWYRTAKQCAERQGQQLNLILLLRRIQEVQFALNFPTGRREGPSVYRGGLTSKQRWVIDRMEEIARGGERFMLFAQSPALVEMLAGHVRKRGVSVVTLHGQLPPKQRMRALDEGFREGTADGLIASYKANRNGINVPQANRVLLYDLDWTPKTIDQAVARVVRPEQLRDVVVDEVHVRGSLDVYMAQCVNGKRNAIGAGLDWGEQEESEYLHLDHIFESFIDDLAKHRGVDRSDLRRSMRDVA